MAAKLTIDVLSLFPDMVEAPLGGSILGKARDRGLLEIRCHNIRDWTTDKHRKTDDYLCGGGQGMLLKPEPIFAAVEELRRRETRVVLMTPQGRTFNQSLAAELAASGGHLIILCGHYEGVDHRVVEELVDMELSIGDYILTGGELAAMVLVDCVSRFIPGVLGSSESPEEESFSDGLLEYPQYTRPREIAGMEVPEVLLNGDHAKIRAWRRQESLRATLRFRPDLLESAPLTDKERRMVEEMKDACSQESLS